MRRVSVEGLWKGLGGAGTKLVLELESRYGFGFAVVGRRKGGSKLGVDSVRFSLVEVLTFPTTSSAFLAEFVLEWIEVGIVLSDPERVCFRWTGDGLNPGLMRM